MKLIKDRFQEVASAITNGSCSAIVAANKSCIDQFFALWKMRAIFRDKDAGEVSFVPPGNGEPLFDRTAAPTLDEEELMERAGIYFFRDNGCMPGHRFNGDIIHMNIIWELRELRNVQWGVMCPRHGQFLVPDYPASLYVPITPTIALYGNDRPVYNGMVTESNVREINASLAKDSCQYYFARNLHECL